MQRAWLIGPPLILLTLTGVTRLSDLGQRMSALERNEQSLPEHLRELALELECTSEELERVRGDLAAVEESRRSKEAGLRSRLDSITSEVERSQEEILLALSDQDSQIRALESIRQSLEATDLERHVREAKLDSDQRLSQLGTRLQELQADLSIISGSMERDVDQLWEELVAPTVQLAGVSTVGSGVLLRSYETEQEDQYETLLITAWHVVRDIIAESGETRPPIPVAIHHVDGRIQHETATLLENEVGLDVALLRLDSTAFIDHGAVLASRERLEAVRTFERIYAVGCPLGNDPIPTPGEVAHPRHSVDGSTYWMISAPTYIGNSGGPIFDAQNFELLGIFSKIYTHGSLRPTVVPHMGLVTPLHLVYDWLEGLDNARLVAAPGEEGALTVVRESTAKEARPEGKSAEAAVPAPEAQASTGTH